jgi:hypothetical protein
MSVVCQLSLRGGGVFIGVNGTSTDLERSVWRQVVASWPSHIAGQPGGVTSTDSGFSSSCRRVATKARAEPPQTLAVPLLLSLSLKSIRENMITMILWFLNIRQSGTLFGMWFLTLARQMFLFILPSKG